MDQVNGKKRQRRKKKRAYRARILFFVLLFILIFVFLTLGIKSSISKKEGKSLDDVTGLWDIDGITKYEFDGKGNGKMILPSSEYLFTYKIDGNQISIHFEDDSASDAIYQYSVNSDHMQFKGLSKGAVDVEFRRESK